MFQSARKHMRAIAMIGVASALVVGGVAAAQGGSESGSSSEGGSQGRGQFNVHFGGPPPLGPGMQDLTYAELHVQKEGKAQVIRLDQGKITAVDDSSITLSENDGSEVTIPVDSDTKVMGNPHITFSSSGGKTTARPAESTLDDLEVGQQVTVSAPEGEAAESIAAMPKKGEMSGPPMGGPMPPPPGAALGSAKQGSEN
jgi:hypothetical protein